MLQITENQYLKIYERASEYLFATRALDEKKKQEAVQDSIAKAEAAQSEQKGDDGLQNEIQSLLTEEPVEEDTEVIEAKPLAPPLRPPAPPSSAATKKATKTEIFTVPEALQHTPEEFALRGPTKTVARVVAPQVTKIAAPKLHSAAGTQKVGSIVAHFDGAKRSEDLISGLLQSLVEKGLFKKSALIVVSKDKTEAIVVAARGPNIGNGQRLPITDPLSPLAQCFSKVQSFGNKSSPVSPFGSKAFALAPIDADHDTPVALYADCGDLALTFEARRVFRTVVEVLNQKLPTLPGGIPVEI